MKSCSLDDRVTLLSQVNARAATDTSDVLREKVEALERRRCPSATKQMQGTGAGMGTRGSEKRLKSNSRSSRRCLQREVADTHAKMSRIQVFSSRVLRFFVYSSTLLCGLQQGRSGVPRLWCPSVFFHHLRRCPWIRFEASFSLLKVF